MKKRTIALMVALILCSNLLTYRVTKGLYRWGTYTPPSSTPGGTDKTPKREELQSFLEVLDILSERYFEEVSVQQLIDAAIKGMVDSLGDQQTSYLDPEHWERMMISTKGSFSGIGIEISSVEGYITVITPIKGTPGERAGLLPEDRIVEVDGKDIMGITTMEAVSLIRGPEGTSVTLKIMREGSADPIIFQITRGNILLPSVFPKVLTENIGFIEITNFDEHTGEDFSVALMELENQGINGLILDLRDNPGGLLSEAIKVAQELLPAGPITHVVDREGKNLNTYYSYGVAKTYPIVILVNGASASASEIIAGAFQDSKAGVLVGTKTYGKATVQHLEELYGNSGLRYTVAKYQTPDGRDINGTGLEPDVSVELPDNFLYHHPLTLDLKSGDENSNVMFLQRILQTLGYKVPDSGVFEAETEKAVRSFQASKGLPVTGIVNHDTRKKLQGILEDVLDKMDTQKQKAVEIILGNRT